MKNLELIFALLVILALIGGGYFVLRGGGTQSVSTFKPVELQKVEVGKPVPDISLTDFSGNSTKIADYKSKVVVIDFWAAWCPFCVAEMGELEKVHQAQKDKLVILGVHRTDTEPQETGFRFAQKRGVTYPLIADQDGALYNTFRQGINAMPLAVFIDKEGIVRDIKFGPKTEKEIQEKISVLLE